jgi:hypothetical protein
MEVTALYAILVAEIPPTAAKPPPTYKLFVESTARARTPLLLITAPIEDHVEVDGVHLAILFAKIPPAVVKYPPTYSTFFDESTARVRTVLFTPVPKEDHVEVDVVHLAI